MSDPNKTRVLYTGVEDNDDDVVDAGLVRATVFPRDDGSDKGLRVTSGTEGTIVTESVIGPSRVGT